MKRILTGFLCCFLLLTAASGASAYQLTGEAGAYIDYDYIGIYFSGTGDTLGTSLLSQAVITGGNTVQDETQVMLESADGSYFAWAETDITDAGMDYQDISGYTSISGVDAFGISQASALFSGRFQAETSGTLTLSVDYYLYSVADAGQGQTVTSDASVFLDINGVQAGDTLSFTAAEGEWFAYETDWETLTLSFDLNAGDVVDFSVLALADTTASPVPIPGTAVLLGMGLSGLLGIRRNA